MANNEVLLKFQGKLHHCNALTPTASQASGKPMTEGVTSPSNIARARSGSLSCKARLSRVHHKEVELAKCVRGDWTDQG